MNAIGMRLLVTAAGAGPAVSIVKALRADSSNFVCAVDMSKSAAGLYLASTWRLVPASSAPEFGNCIREICKELSIQMVIPILDNDAVVLSGERAMFAAIDACVAANSPECIRSANDKLFSYEVCRSAGINQPEHFSDPRRAPTHAYPLLAKPRQGVSARGILRFENVSELDAFHGNVQDYLWQSFIEGDEYTIDTFGNPRMPPFVAVPRLRRVVKAGQAVQAVTSDAPDLIDFAARCCEAFGTTDVACVQVIRSRRDGQLFFIEINPRYGTGVSLSIAAGINFPRLQWNRYRDPEMLAGYAARFTPGLEMIRHWAEIYIFPGNDKPVFGHTS